MRLTLVALTSMLLGAVPALAGVTATVETSARGGQFQAFAVEDSQWTLEQGRYRSTGSGRFLYPEVTSWADELLLKGFIGSYDGRVFDFEVELVYDAAEEAYTGEGEMDVGYTDGTSCGYPVRVLLYPAENGFYAKTKQQRTVCVENCRRCEPQDLTNWTRHEDPYEIAE